MGKHKILGKREIKLKGDVIVKFQNRKKGFLVTIVIPKSVSNGKEQIYTFNKRNKIILKLNCKKEIKGISSIRVWTDYITDAYGSIKLQDIQIPIETEQYEGKITIKPQAYLGTNYYKKLKDDEKMWERIEPSVGRNTSPPLTKYVHYAHTNIRKPYRF